MPPADRTAEQIDVDRLVSEISEHGATADTIGELQRLLRNNRELQQYYGRAVALNTLLEREYQSATSRFEPIVQPQGTGIAGDSLSAIRIQEAVAANAETPPQKRGASVAAIAAVAATILVGWFASPAWNTDADRPIRESAVALGRTEAPTNTDQPLVIRDQRSLQLVCRLTRTASLSSMIVPASLSLPQDAAQAFGLGPVFLHEERGTLERGYLVAVPPDHTMELYVNAEAYDPNSLAIVEIGGNGEASGDSLVFTNQDAPSVFGKRSHQGSVGNWANTNSSLETRYYLLTGSHLSVESKTPNDWKLSDYCVLHESRNLICVGWDDSGYRAGADSSENPNSSRDFDDMGAILRVYPTENAPLRPTERRPRVLTTAEATPNSTLPILAEGRELTASTDDVLAFRVQPGEVAVLRITARCYIPNTIEVQEADTGRVVWSDREATTDDVYQRGSSRGVCVLRNPSDRDSLYRLVSSHAEETDPPGGDWQLSEHRVVRQAPEELTVGFEDSFDDKDWDDIRVQIRWFEAVRAERNMAL